MGRQPGIHTPLKYFNEEDRRQAITQSKNKYMSKPWLCSVCDHELKMGSKWSHCKTKKHIKNTILKALEDDDRFELIPMNENI